MPKEQYISYLPLLQTLNNISVIMLLYTFNIISLILSMCKGNYFIPLTWPIVFCANPAIFIAFQKKKKKSVIPTDPKMFQKIGQKKL